jgi:hypothetical protein
MADIRFSVRQVVNSPTWVVVDDASHRQLVASSPHYDCALMIAALMNGETVEAIQYRDDLLRTNPAPSGL